MIALIRLPILSSILIKPSNTDMLMTSCMTLLLVALGYQKIQYF